MDRDPREIALDPVERTSPSSGDNDTGEVGDQEARIYRDRQKRGTEAAPDPKVKAPEGDRAPGRKP
jgi:hypothetical protein